MAYSVQTDIEKLITPEQLTQLADDDGDGYPEPGTVTEAIAQADAEIDSYLGARYSVPIAPVPALVRQLSLAVAVWRLSTRRGTIKEAWRQAYEDAVALLRRLASGEAVLPASGSGEVATDGSDAPEASTPASDRLYTTGKESAGTSGTLDRF